MLCENHTYPTLPAADMERARRFYETVLGFEPSLVTPAGVMYDARGSSLFLYPSPFAGTNRATACGFEVEDLPSIVAELQKRGVRFEEYKLPTTQTVESINHSPQGDAAWFKDSEGNTIGLFQPSQVRSWPRDEVISRAHV